MKAHAEQGIYVDLLDTTQGYVCGPDLVDLVARMSPAPHHLVIRGALNADANDHVNIDWLKAALAVWQQRGFEVVLTLDNLARGYQQASGADLLTAFPNAALGKGGNPLLNDFIDRFSLNAVSILKQLGPECPARVFVKNEPNLEAAPNGKIPMLVSGKVPVVHPSALAPENYAALLYTTASRIRDRVPGVKHIYPAPLSCLVKFNTDPEGPWMEGYWKAVFGYLHSLGKKGPWVLEGSDPATAPPLFEGVALNMEGAVTEQYALVAARAMAAIKTKYGLVGPNVLGEWGVPGGRAVDADMWTCFGALNRHMDFMSFFKLLAYYPDDPEAYGMVTWGEKDGFIIPKESNKWEGLLTAMFAALEWA